MCHRKVTGLGSPLENFVCWLRDFRDLACFSEFVFIQALAGLHKLMRFFQQSACFRTYHLSAACAEGCGSDWLNAKILWKWSPMIPFLVSSACAFLAGSSSPTYYHSSACVKRQLVEGCDYMPGLVQSIFAVSNLSSA